MGRAIRIAFPGAFYHIISRGVKKLPIFIEDEDFEDYLFLLKRYLNEYDVVLYAYCLMDNHIHLLVETPKANISRFVKVLHGTYARRFNIRHNSKGHVFESLFTSTLVDKDNYLLEVSRYIHLNPVKAKIVDLPEEYKWSSFNYYLSPDKESLWIQTNKILGYFNGSSYKYKEFVYERIKKEIKLEPQKWMQGYFYGSKSFMRKSIEKFERRTKKINKERKRKKDFEEKNVNSNDVVKSVLRYFNIERIDDIQHKRDYHSTKIKAILIYLLRKHTKLGIFEIRELFRYETAGGVSKSIRRVENHLEDYIDDLSKIEEKLDGENRD